MARNTKENLTFEDAVERLENIVNRMEAAELPLDGIIEKYEEGMKLLAFCEEKLRAAEQKIELLTKDKTGKLQRSVLDEKAAAEPEEAPAKKNKATGEISLF